MAGQFYFPVAMRGRIAGWPRAPRPQIASTDAVTRAGQIKYKQPRSPEPDPCGV